VLVHDFLVEFQELAVEYGDTFVVDTGLSLGCIPLASTVDELTSYDVYKPMEDFIKTNR
jgi:hypothetical protein